MMDAPRYYVEQDDNIKGGGDELPTYDDLAAQNGPNSRYAFYCGSTTPQVTECIFYQVWSMEGMGRETVCH